MHTHTQVDLGIGKSEVDRVGQNVSHDWDLVVSYPGPHTVLYAPEIPTKGLRHF